jgi:hypothetical protein
VHRRTLALHQTIRELSLLEVPTVNRWAYDLGNRRAWGQQTRSLFHRLGLRGMSVQTARSTYITVYLPDREDGYRTDRDERRRVYEESRQEYRTVLRPKLVAILRQAYPNARAAVPEANALWPFLIELYHPDRWGVPWREWHQLRAAQRGGA